MVRGPCLQVDPGVVTASGAGVAGTAGGWHSWARSVALAFADASDVVCNAVVWRAVDGYAVRWNPAVTRLAGEVDALGATLGSAATVVDGTDVTAAQLVAGTCRRAGRLDELSRPAYG